MHLRLPRLLLGIGAVTGILSISTTVRAAAAGPHPTITVGNVRVSHDTFAAHSEPDIAENPANPNNLVAGSKFFTDPAKYLFYIGTYYSTDGGQTWHDDGLLPGFDTFIRSSDISFAYGPNGKIVYACVLAHDNTRSGIYVSRSHDGGKTWSQPVTVFEDDTGATFSDKPWITVDASNGAGRGSAYVVWNLDSNASTARDPDSGNAHLIPAFQKRQADGTPQVGIVVSSSSDFGKSWSSPVTIRKFTTQNGNFGLGPIPQVAPNGHLSVAYLAFDSVRDTDGAVHEIYRLDVAESANGGRSFTTHIAVPLIIPLPDQLPNGTFRNFSLPTFAVSPRDGSMVVAWADYRNHHADVYETRSIDSGLTWSAPTRINHDPISNAVDHFQPRLAVAPDGTFTCSWFDRRYSPGNRLVDEAIAQSFNDGKSFAQNIRVTKHSWDASVGAPHVAENSKVTFIGDYQGLAVDNSHVHPLWNDTQGGASQQIRTAVISESVFTTR